MKRAQAVIEYSFLIGMAAITFIAIQVYLRRGIQGKFQAAADQMADQYGHGVSEVKEHSESRVAITEVTAPGWESPNTRTKTRGSYSSSSRRGVASLDQNWP